MNIKDLRLKYPEFIYESFKHELNGCDLHISFHFSLNPDIVFRPSIVIRNIDTSIYKNLEQKVIDNLIFHLGLIEMLSYWKATSSPVITVKAGYLDDNQITWWSKLLIKGMGEFFYLNKIDFTSPDFVVIKADSNIKFLQKAEISNLKKLVPLSGGKDSTVTLNLLKELSDIGLFMLNPTKATRDIAAQAKVSNQVLVDRNIDSRLIELNAEGYLNGHTPFSAYLAFLSLFCAYLFDYSGIVFSNERSSNESNVRYLGYDINHQYSKSFEFENAFREYNNDYLSSIDYYSFLRPLYEIQISKLAASFPLDLPIIKSCNRGQKENIWCGDCPKCLSTYILLYPFVETKQIVGIFGKDLYEDVLLIDLLDSLVDETKVKPFECVGTYDELKAGLYLSINKYNSDLPVLLKRAQEVLKRDSREWKIVAEGLMSSWDENNNAPENLSQLLKGELNAQND